MEAAYDAESSTQVTEVGAAGLARNLKEASDWIYHHAFHKGIPKPELSVFVTSIGASMAGARMIRKALLDPASRVKRVLITVAATRGSYLKDLWTQRKPRTSLDATLTFTELGQVLSRNVFTHVYVKFGPIAIFGGNASIRGEGARGWVLRCLGQCVPEIVVQAHILNARYGRFLSKMVARATATRSLLLLVNIENSSTVRQLAKALRKNTSFVHFGLHGLSFSGPHCLLLAKGLAGHPTLVSIDLRGCHADTTARMFLAYLEASPDCPLRYVQLRTSEEREFHRQRRACRQETRLGVSEEDASDAPARSNCQSDVWKLVQQKEEPYWVDPKGALSRVPEPPEVAQESIAERWLRVVLAKRRAGDRALYDTVFSKLNGGHGIVLIVFEYLFEKISSLAHIRYNGFPMDDEEMDDADLVQIADPWFMDIFSHREILQSWTQN